MALERIEVSTLLPASAERIYRAWLDSVEHSKFTGADAKIEQRVGGHHETHGGYARGRHLALDHARRIVQTWRSSDFPDGAIDSRVEIQLHETPGGTRVMLVHSDIPEGQGAMYREGWQKYYFDPMQEYFKGDRMSAEGENGEGDDEGSSIWDTNETPATPPPVEVDEAWTETPEIGESPTILEREETTIVEEIAPPKPKAKKPAAKKPAKKPAAKKPAKKPVAKKKPAKKPAKKPVKKAAKKKPAKKKSAKKRR